MKDDTSFALFFKNTNKLVDDMSFTLEKKIEGFCLTDLSEPIFFLG
jgi:hypothetical protein